MSDLLDMTVREIIGQNGFVANYDRPDGYAFVIARGEDAKDLSRWAKALKILERTAEYEDLLVQAEQELREQNDE